MKYVSKQKFHAVLKLKKDTFALDINRENFRQSLGLEIPNYVYFNLFIDIVG